jgi:hypothetical protein
VPLLRTSVRGFVLCVFWGLRFSLWNRSLERRDNLPACALTQPIIFFSATLFFFVVTHRFHRIESIASIRPHRLDGKHTVFGRVLDDASMLTVRKCEAVPVNGSTPRLPLTITQCGEL